MKFDLVTPAPTTPVDLDTAKLHVRQDEDADDAYITQLIQVATELCEVRSHRRFVTQVYDVYLDGWWSKTPTTGSPGTALGLTGSPLYVRPFADAIKLPFGPLRSVEWVKYYDTSNTLTTWDPDNYVVSEGDNPRIAPNPGLTYPTLADRIDSVVIRCTVGDDATAVPARAKQAVLLCVGHWYESRTPVADTATMPDPFGLDTLLNSLSNGSTLFC